MEISKGDLVELTYNGTVHIHPKKESLPREESHLD
jgi:hypothetical protein